MPGLALALDHVMIARMLTPGLCNAAVSAAALITVTCRTSLNQGTAGS
jgi:hypothetical protein